MDITREDFIGAVSLGWERYGYLSGVYFNPYLQCEGEKNKGCGCAIGVAATMLGVKPFELACAMRLAPDTMGSQLWERITNASDGAQEKHHALQAVKAAVNDTWPSGLVLTASSNTETTD